ncbi:MAG: carbohydrate ABC transporter permease [Tagaea sp.]|nr:carbohydrate ABC transporter permease [Tagaea sp.]
MSRPVERARIGAARHAVLGLAALAVMLPFLWVAAAAFKNQIDLLMGRILTPPVLTSFQEVLFSRYSDYVENLVNSLLVGAVSTVLVLIMAVLAAYALHRLMPASRFGRAISGWWLVFHMLPPIAMVGAWFLIFRMLGLYGTHAGLILAHTTLNFPMALWIVAVFVRQMPVELEEAARIDGASTLQILVKVVVPMVRPGLAAAGILCFLFSWNEFAVAINLTTQGSQTVPVAIAKFAQEYEIKHTQMAAAAVLSIVPAIVLLLVGQRHIVRGLTTGIGK